MICELEHKIFTVKDTEFESLALDLFKFQYKENIVYRQYIELLKLDPLAVDSIRKIPFLPIDFFKSHRVVTTSFEPGAVFESSGTTQTSQSRHLVRNLSIYEQSFKKTFEYHYGEVSDWCILGLLPAYLERKNSSLVAMVDELIRASQHPQSGFYLYEHEKLGWVLNELKKEKQKTILIGVTFALLDFAEKYKTDFHNTIVIETGGMKGRKVEMTRAEVHSRLKAAWNLPAIHAEYGMTELLSQAYSKADGIFESPPWLKVLLREEDDPMVIQNQGRGLINVIDLANIYSCAFIATDDIGLLYPDQTFEVLGRRDYSDLRGCSFMAATI